MCPKSASFSIAGARFSIAVRSLLYAEFFRLQRSAFRLPMCPTLSRMQAGQFTERCLLRSYLLSPLCLHLFTVLGYTRLIVWCMDGYAGKGPKESSKPAGPEPWGLRSDLKRSARPVLI